MSRQTLGRAAGLSLALGIGTIACTPTTETDHVASAGDIGRHAAGDAARLAGQARESLSHHEPRKAARRAELAVAADPGRAAYRLLLGQAYLADGRFASAETSFRDALAVSPDDPRAELGLALAETANGHAAGARTRLAGLGGKVSDGDLGLALALSGNRAQAIDMLAALVRSGKSDARSRQNLAFALALDNRWQEARGVAMQDVGPDRIEDQIAHWATLAASNDPRTQVAALLGATPAVADPDRPAMLALATGAPASVQPALALSAASAAGRSPVPVADPPPVVAVGPPPPTMTTLALAAPVLPEAPAMPVRMAAAEAIPEVPALLAVSKPQPAQKSYVRVAIRKPVAPGPLLPMRASGWVVQLGAFSRALALEAAWSKVSRLTPNLATFTPVSGRTSASGAALVRLSVSGFAERRDATRLCERIKLRGGACFVRASGNDTPWQWARRDAGTRVAIAGVMRRG